MYNVTGILTPLVTTTFGFAVIESLGLTPVISSQDEWQQVTDKRLDLITISDAKGTMTAKRHDGHD
jgi:hypothetical protein